MGCHTGKKLYRTSSDARRSSKRHKARAIGKLRAYYCRACNGYHLSGEPKRKP